MCKIICGSGFLIVFHIAFIITQMEKKLLNSRENGSLLMGFGYRRVTMRSQQFPN
jgi:hypothetical protein